MESMNHKVKMKIEIPQHKDQLPVHKEDDMPHDKYYLNTVMKQFNKYQYRTNYIELNLVYVMHTHTRGGGRGRYLVSCYM